MYCPELGLRDASGRLVVVGGLDEFREHLGGELTITLLRGIGEGFEVHEMDLREVGASVQELGAGQGV